MKNNSKTSLFLMELIIVILFFSIASVVCVQLFVNAYSTNENTKQISKGNVLIQNIAESFSGCGGDLGEMSALFAGSADVNTSEAGMNLYFTEDGKPTDSSRATYTASISVHDDNGTPVSETAGHEGCMLTANISIYQADSGDVIAVRDVSHYVPYRLESAQ